MLLSMDEAMLSNLGRRSHLLLNSPALTVGRLLLLHFLPLLGLDHVVLLKLGKASISIPWISAGEREAHIYVTKTKQNPHLYWLLIHLGQESFITVRSPYYCVTWVFRCSVQRKSGTH